MSGGGLALALRGKISWTVGGCSHRGRRGPGGQARGPHPATPHPLPLPQALRAAVPPNNLPVKGKTLGAPSLARNTRRYYGRTTSTLYQSSSNSNISICC